MINRAPPTTLSLVCVFDGVFHYARPLRPAWGVQQSPWEMLCTMYVTYGSGILGPKSLWICPGACVLCKSATPKKNSKPLANITPAKQPHSRPAKWPCSRPANHPHGRPAKQPHGRTTRQLHSRPTIQPCNKSPTWPHPADQPNTYATDGSNRLRRFPQN